MADLSRGSACSSGGHEGDSAVSAVEERAVSATMEEEGKTREIGGDGMVENGEGGSRVGRIRFLVLLIDARGTGSWAGYPILKIVHRLQGNMIYDDTYTGRHRCITSGMNRHR